MTDRAAALSSLADSVFSQLQAWARDGRDGTGTGWQSPFAIKDEALGEMVRCHEPHVWDQLNEEIATVVDAVLTGPEFAQFVERGDSRMLLTKWGGRLSNATDLLSGVLSSASMQMRLLREPDDASTFVRIVHDNLRQLRQALKGERFIAQEVIGFAGIELPYGVDIRTPWGVLQSAPRSVHQVEPDLLSDPLARTSCVLVADRDTNAVFEDQVDAGWMLRQYKKENLAEQRMRLLLPLACAMASVDAEWPAGPRTTWRLGILPFDGYIGHSSYREVPVRRRPVNLKDLAGDIEALAQTLESEHSPKVEVAAARIVSAVAHRTDRVDVLIDSVLAWENLVGTDREVTFQVTAALAKVLERDPSGRQARRKRLKKIYGLRSQIVHGASRTEEDSLDDDAREALDVALRVSRLFYERGRDWLDRPSGTRAEEILLDEWHCSSR